MNNDFYGNNQQNNSWQTPNSNPYGYYNYGAYANSDYFKKIEQRKKETKEIRKIGKNCGMGALAYLVFAYGTAFLLSLLSRIFPSLNAIFYDTTATFAFDAVTSVLSLGLPFLIIYLIFRGKKLIGSLPYEKPQNRESAVYLTMLCVPVMVFSSLLINYISAIVQTILGVEFNSNIGDTKTTGLVGILTVCISIAIVPATIEEFVVRGVTMQPLRKYGDKFAIIMSAIFFAVMHGNMLQLPYTFVGGLILGYLAIKTKSMWPPMVLHFVNNFYSAVVLIVSDNFGDSAGNIATYIIWALFVVSGIVGFTGYMKNREGASLSKGESVLNTKEKIIAFVKNGPMIIMIIVFIAMALGSVS